MLNEIHSVNATLLSGVSWKELNWTDSTFDDGLDSRSTDTWSTIQSSITGISYHFGVLQPKNDCIFIIGQRFWLWFKWQVSWTKAFRKTQFEWIGSEANVLRAGAMGWAPIFQVSWMAIKYTRCFFFKLLKVKFKCWSWLEKEVRRRIIDVLMLVAPPGPCPLSTFEAAEISVQKFQLSSLPWHYNRWHRQRQ